LLLYVNAQNSPESRFRHNTLFSASIWEMLQSFCHVEPSGNRTCLGERTSAVKDRLFMFATRNKKVEERRFKGAK